MRRRALLLAVCLAAAAAVTALPQAPTAAAAGTPPACPWANNMYQYCNRYTGAGPIGSIGLLGDSVLLGSADGASNPGLPSMLAAKGWGPINLVATLGMKTKWTTNNNVSAVYWLQRWHTLGFHPDVIAINLGANHLGTWDKPTCTFTSYSYCKTAILQVMDEIALHQPQARVWWAKVNFQPFGLGYGAAMLGWNRALDEVAAERPNLVLWDWPTALATADPAISMDANRIHPNSATQYVKRSTLMATSITDAVGIARFTGPRGATPPGFGAGLPYEPVGPIRLGPFVAPHGSTTEIDLSAYVPAGTVAVAVMLEADPRGDGYVTVYPCGDPQPEVSSLNYAAGTPRVAQAVVRLSAERKLCAYNYGDITLRASLVGRFDPTATMGFTPIAPIRPFDSRHAGKSSDPVIAVPASSVAAVTVTVTGPSSGGWVGVKDCDSSDAPQPLLDFRPDETAAGAGFAPTSAGGTICLHVEPVDAARPPDVILDVTGTFQTGAGLLFVPAQATRLLDTRNLIGGWVGRQGTGQVLDIVAAPEGARAVTGTVTMVNPMFWGWLTAFQCGQPLPPTSSVNADAGLVMANSVTVGIDPVQRTLCLYASQNTHSLFDAVGWWIGATS